MAATSLVFGGLSIMHSSWPTDADGGTQPRPSLLATLASPSEMIRRVVLTLSALFALLRMGLDALYAVDVQTLLLIAIILSSNLVVAYVTNPNDLSFRMYLADQSLHQHLRQQLHDSPPPATPPLRRAGDAMAGSSSSSSSSDESLYLHEARLATSSPHVVTFANRISISLRTPPYVRRDFALFSVVSVTPVPPVVAGSPDRPALPARCLHCQQPHVYGDQPRSWYVGAFGRWFGGTLGCSPQPRSSAAGKQPVAAAAATDDESQLGVLKMIAEDDLDGIDGEQRESSTDSAVPNGAARSTTHGDTSSAPVSATTSKSHKGRRKKAPNRPRPKEAAVAAAAAAAAQAMASAAANTESKMSPDREKMAGSLAASSASTSEAHPTTTTTCSLPSAALRAPQLALEAELASSLQSSSAAVAELQTQLEAVRQSSDTSRGQLQAQLDELRTRKREEDATRLDLKGRMKSLDENKRQAEATKREAERRLKVATGAREAIQGRIEAKTRAVEALRRREESNAKRQAESAEHKRRRLEEVRTELEAKGPSEEEVKEEIAQLKAKLVTLEQRLAEEAANLEAARQEAAQRHRAEIEAYTQELAREEQELVRQHQEAIRQQFMGFDAAAQGLHVVADKHAPPTQPSHSIYPLLSGPGQGRIVSAEMEPRRGSQGLGDAELPGWAAPGVSPHLGASVGVGMGLGGDGFGGPLDTARDSHVATMTPPRSLAVNGRASEEFDGFDPTLPMPRDARSLAASASQGFVGYFDQRLAPFASTPEGVPPAPPFPTLAVPPPQAPLTPSGPPGSAGLQVPITPMTPFSTDLLPSNLFLNQDDDERHQGILPGTRSERVEAALGRFGLDNSDTSDMGDGEAKSDIASEAGDAVAEVPAKVGEASDVEETKATGQGSLGKSGRNWWGGRSRGASKDRHLAAEAQSIISSDAASESEEPVTSPATQGKRRSLSIFPKLSLNPGAKAFSSSASTQPHQARAVSNGVPGAGGVFGGNGNATTTRPVIRGPLDAWPLANPPVGPSLHHPVGTDFEAIRRAFEANSQAEEEGRRSWSAFDSWATGRPIGAGAGAGAGAATGGVSASSNLNPDGPASRFYRLHANVGPDGSPGPRSSSDSLPRGFGSTAASSGGAFGGSSIALGSYGGSGGSIGPRGALGGGAGTGGGGGGESSAWPDELFSNLTRTSSHPSSGSSASPSVPRPSSRIGSRFPFWRDSSGGTAVGAVSRLSGSMEGGGGEPNGSALSSEGGSVANGNGNANGNDQAVKQPRRFPWSRRPESAPSNGGGGGESNVPEDEGGKGEEAGADEGKAEAA